MIRSILSALLLVPAALLPASPPPLPKALTSFGSATCDGSVYVCGGHMGKAHDYSKATVSGAMWRLSLSRPDAWESLPGNVPLQSPGVAAWNGKVYLAGGMQPQNEPGASGRLLSLDHTALFDPAKNAWEKLPPLPQPRSSHALAVMGDKLYAIGGWPLNTGGPEPKPGQAPAKKYHDTMVVLDLASPAPGWQSLPQPWQRRALTAAVFAGKIWCIGGMTEDNELSSDIDVYDPATKQWSTAPKVAENDRAKAFGCAACVAGGALFVSPEGGKVYRIGADAKGWVECGKLAKPRYFHQLIALDATHLMAIGGMEKGVPLDDVEIVTVEQASPAP
jgi:kelch repeat and BTB domain-containing protein 12